MKHIKTHRTISLLILLALLIAISFLISILKFKSPNPIATGYGLTQIIFTDRDYILIRNTPKVFLAKPKNAENNLITMMSDSGYTYNKSKRLGSLLVFEKGNNEQHVFFSVNGYYSIWNFK